MRKVDVSPITTSIGMPIKAGTLTHLQSAYQEAISALGAALAGSTYDSGKVYILTGCRNSGSGSSYVISAGAVFYGGEVYLVDPASFTISNPNVAVGVVTTTFFADAVADSVQFTDGVLRNVHQIRKIVLKAGLSGSGAGNFVDFVDVTRKLQGAIGEIKIWNWKFYGGDLDDYFNLTTGLGIHPYTAGWAICDGQNGTDNMGGRAAVGYNGSDSDYDTPYDTFGGSKTVTLVQANLPAVSLDVPVTGPDTSQDDTGSGRFAMGSTGTDAGPYPVLHTANMGTNTPFNVVNPYRTVLYVQRIV
ncbi:hypothetical protein F0L74_09800 [Chitinophaga agrisoli]|uniref:Microcystin-dependent protein n=1 Tax=Chitinophaga agrisoli TaxID=2607653 RepID=A0A5B2VWW7_9BACT|nr:hypothetical protein [Chitinophaga agrisoli]KAA2242812.1 hypothetical protein F0L74_09800 [Chitinophaga agrisoli]